MNRAIDGDIVAVELLPKSQWKAASSRLAPRDKESKATGGNTYLCVMVLSLIHRCSCLCQGETKDAKENENETSGGARPTGKVVGIVKRNW
jgi:exosome complex exonuclease DIS3/RRP44